MGGESRKFPAVSGKQRLPLLARGFAALANAGIEMLAHAFGYEERRVFRPTIGVLGEPDLLLAERLPMRR
jgi:hypothetical protein